MICRITIICITSPLKATEIVEFEKEKKKASIALYPNETVINKK